MGRLRAIKVQLELELLLVPIYTPVANFTKGRSLVSSLKLRLLSQIFFNFLVESMDSVFMISPMLGASALAELLAQVPRHVDNGPK